MTKWIARATAAAALTLLAACGPEPIEWGQAVNAPPAGPNERLSVDASGKPGAMLPPGVAAPSAPRQCAGSVRVAGDSASGWYSVWWELQPDSTAHIMVARSDDGRSWKPAIRVDSADVGRSGCRRPAPSIAADGANVHVAYGMAAREGTGIFASHSMDEGRMFHWPVAVVYGDRVGSAAIAARGNLVAVAYEDPNSVQPRIGVAVSNTMAHLFQVRQEVTRGGTPATAPDVAVSDDRVAVSWSEGPRLAGTSPDSGATKRMLRVGVLR